MTYGTVNVDSVVNSDGVTSGGLYGFKNRILNGGMVIDQRNAGAAVNGSGGNQTYPVDRFFSQIYGTSGNTTGQQSTVAPAGFYNSLKLSCQTADASVGATDIAWYAQNIEGLNLTDMNFGSANAATFTLSFWVYSNLTGTFCVAFKNSAETRTYVAEYTINAATTWEKKTITVAGDTTGTWLTSNGAGLKVNFMLMAGSTYQTTANTWSASSGWATSNQTNLLSSTSNYIHITGVQLEKGSTATSFDYRPYGTELALCQRYFISYGGQANYERFGTCLCSGPTTGIVQMPFPIEMRAVPTLTYPSASYIGVYTGSAVVTLSAIGGDSPSSKVGMFSVATTGLTTGATYQCLAQNTSLARLNWSAEL